MEESLHNEIMILKAFNHDNIVKLYVILLNLLLYLQKIIKKNGNAKFFISTN